MIAQLREVRAARFELVPEALDALRAGRRSAPAFADIDGDGRVDLIVGRETGGAAVYRNSGTGAAIKFTELKDLAIGLPSGAAPALADLTSDGVLDLVSGTLSGGLVFYRGGR